MTNLSWPQLKALIISGGYPYKYTQDDNSYRVTTFDGGNTYSAIISITTPESADQTDFETSYLSGANNGKLLPSQADSDGATLSRVKVAPTGWNFNYRMIEIQLATVGGIVNNDINGSSVGDATITLYDTSGVVITDPTLQSNAVKTVVDIEPPYNICLAGGCLRMDTSPTSDVYLNVIAVPDIPAIYGGSKLFIQNINLSYIDGSIGLDADGRAAKQLNYNASLHTNKLRFQFTHTAGYQFWCAILLEIYKQ